MDAGDNAAVSYYQVGKIQMTLTEGLDDIKLQPFLVDRLTGAVSLNFDPQRRMKGYFDFMVLANDTDGLQDTARVFIYLLREDQRVRFVLRQHPPEVRNRIESFREWVIENWMLKLNGNKEIFYQCEWIAFQNFGKCYWCYSKRGRVQSSRKSRRFRRSYAYGSLSSSGQSSRQFDPRSFPSSRARRS